MEKVICIYFIIMIGIYYLYDKLNYDGEWKDNKKNGKGK